MATEEAPKYPETIFDDAIRENMIRAAKIVEDAIATMVTPISGTESPWSQKWREDSYTLILRGLLNKDVRTRWITDNDFTRRRRELEW